MKFTKNWKQATHLTHSGKFHADEVFSTALLSRVHRKMVLSRVQVVPENTNAFVYDIGGGDFDHHQPTHEFRKNGIPYAAFGLVWRKFGTAYTRDFLDRHYKLLELRSKKDITPDLVTTLVENLDKHFIEPIDADDNGVSVHSFSSVIDLFNPTWNEGVDNDKQFLEAVSVADKLLERALTFEVSNLAALRRIEAALDHNIEKLPDGLDSRSPLVVPPATRYKDKILILDHYLHFSLPLHETKNPHAKDILFVVYPSNRNGFNIRAVAKKQGSFDNRKDLPASWAGLSGTALESASGVQGALFCHNSRFLAVADTLAAALELAEKAL